MTAGNFQSVVISASQAYTQEVDVWSRRRLAVNQVRISPLYQTKVKIHSHRSLSISYQKSV